MAALEKLIELGGESLGGSISRNCTDVPTGLLPLYATRNGFFAFECALLIRPFRNDGGALPLDIHSWNEPELWRSMYGSLIASTSVCFAEDAFGNQFALQADGSFVFIDAETAECQPLGDSLEMWARSVLLDWDYWSGHKVANEWQQAVRPLRRGERLVPKQPIVLGGNFDVANLMAWPDHKGMRSRGFLATQLWDVPDGTPISFELTE